MRGVSVKRIATVTAALLLAGAFGVAGAVYARAPEYVTSYSTTNLVRIHVVGNSDSKEDQRIKLAVRDRIIEDISPAMNGASSADEAEGIIRRNLDAIARAAAEVVREWGGSYGAMAEIGRFSFPPRVYGQLALPAGEYRALRVVLGEGRGGNWWCVMFPPLCLADVTGAKGPAEGPHANPPYAKPGVRSLVADWLRERATEARLALTRITRDRTGLQ